MRSVGQLPVVLYFIQGMVPSESEMSEATDLGGVQIRFRNASLVDNHGAEALEECDGVMGDVPERYRAAFGSDWGDVSGIGALRMVHQGEPGVTRSQPVNQDSRFTGDWVEEDRKRAARGLPPNDPNSAPVWPNENSKPTRPDGTAPDSFSGTNAIKPDAPTGIAGAAQVTPRMLGQDGTGAGGERSVFDDGFGSRPSVGSGDDKPLSKQSRAELNETAKREGIEDADDLPNASAVIEAIEAKRRGE